MPFGHAVAHGHLPSSVPYATASTHGWRDVTAGAQLIFWALYHAFGGLRGLVVAQALAAGVAFAALAEGLRRQSGEGAALVVSVAVLGGALPAVAVTGVQLFSLALFPLLLLLLESECRIWLAVPLIAVWGNLHGGVLTGLGLLACYAVLRDRRALPVLAASVVAVFLNPALWHTPTYYRGVFDSALAREGKGMWAPLAATPLDLALVAVAVVLLAAVARRPDVRLWEAFALFGLGAGTAHAVRTGTWFLFVLAYPAARALRLRAPKPRLSGGIAVVCALVAVALLAKGPQDPGSTRLARTAAARGPVLADPILGQQVALAGGRVWVDNPVDAFRYPDQKLYVDWLDGKGDAALRHAAFVLVRPSSKAGRHAAADRRLVRIGADSHAVLYRVSRG